MAETSIGWTRGDDGAPGRTWNPTAGCSIVSPGCSNCYAMRMAARLARMGQKKYVGTTKQRDGKAVWTGKVNLSADSLEDPLGWKTPKRIFVNSMSDLWHKDIPDSFIDRVIATVYECQWHTFQVLTKRPERQYRYFADAGPRVAAIAAAAHAAMAERSTEKASLVSVSDIEEDLHAQWPLSNLWLGTSCEDQERADERIPWLLKTNAAIRFLSCEPLLGPIFLPVTHSFTPEGDAMVAAMPRIHWVIVGGESGPGSRPCNVAWIRSIAAQCKGTDDTACFVKQLGALPMVDFYGKDDGLREWALARKHVIYEPAGFNKWHVRSSREGYQPPIGSMIRVNLTDRKGETKAEFPPELQIQEYPKRPGAAAF